MILRSIFISTALLSLAACNRARPQPEVVTTAAAVRDIYIEELPEGTEEVCWEEPKVIQEKNGPGVDPEGHWYHAPHTAIREVKMGRWKPCAQ